MVEVKARPGESIDNLLKRFKKAVENNGILSDYRKKEYYEKPSIARKRKHAAALKRARTIAKKRKPKISKISWQWNKDRTKKISTKRKPLQTQSKTYTNTNNTNTKPRYNSGFKNKPYRGKTKR